ncbi:hypothetical protein HFO85_14560 [Rhizobium leguminosarum]|nr:hypothetical protein [Rhizobium leguminosarum]
MELDTADHRRSSGVTSGLHRMLTLRPGLRKNKREHFRDLREAEMLWDAEPALPDKTAATGYRDSP